MIYAAHQGGQFLSLIDRAARTYETVRLNGRDLDANEKVERMQINANQSVAFFTKKGGNEILKVNLDTYQIETAALLAESMDSLAFYPENELVASFTASRISTGRPHSF